MAHIDLSAVWEGQSLLAMLVAVLVSMMVGQAWYMVFGKAWARATGMGELTPEKKRDMRKTARPAYAVALAGAVFVAFTLRYLVLAFEVDGWMGGLQAGFWPWLGFVVPVTSTAAWFEGKDKTAWLINVGNHLVSFVAMGVVLGAWPS